MITMINFGNLHYSPKKPPTISSHFPCDPISLRLKQPLWKIPWMEEPGGLQSMGSLRVGHD